MNTCISFNVWSATASRTSLESVNLHQFAENQNASGCRSNCNKINNAISQGIYDVLCIQESWLVKSVLNEEIIGMTPYSIYRRDRSDFHHQGTNTPIIVKCFIMPIIEYMLVHLVTKPYRRWKMPGKITPQQHQSSSGNTVLPATRRLHSTYLLKQSLFYPKK